MHRDVVSVEMYWREQMQCSPPEGRYIAGWLHRASLEQIFEAIEFLAPNVRNGRLSPESAGRILSAEIKRAALRNT